MSDDEYGSSPNEPAPTNVHWFEREGTWWVVAGETRTAFADRAAAFEAARERARQLLPSQLVPSAPDARGMSPTVEAHSVVVADHVAEAGGSVDWSRLAGPASLGRSLLISELGIVPSPWADCERVQVTTAHLGDPKFLARVRRAFLTRARSVYALHADVTAPSPTIRHDDIWSVPVDHDFTMEATWALMSGNAVDARGDLPNWEWARRAMQLGAMAGGTADVLLPDGRAAWCDGGPLRLWTKDALGDDDVVIPREALVCGSIVPVIVEPVVADLAPDQLDAVSEPDVRSRIIAPAGSGKTRVLTERARHLLRSSVPSDALTLVAFNKRAQLEMVERTQDLPGLQVRTLNALALAILNGAQGFAPRGEHVVTIDEVQVRDILATLVKFPRRANTDPAAPWIEALSRVRLGLRSPQVVEAEFDGDVEGLAGVFPRYRNELARRRAVDFDEQIYLCIGALLAEPSVRVEAQRRCQLLLVDEFQDLTPAHMLLLRLLAGPPLSIFGVGDDDQTIYGYSGATTQWLVHFEDFVPSPTYHALDVNYRCPERVVAAATNLLSRNRRRVDKSIRAGPNNDASPHSMRIIAAEQPEAATTEIVRQLLADGARPDQIAVLARVNSVLVPVQAALVEAGVPVQVRDGGGFLQRAGVAAALAWLRLAVASEGFTRSDVMLAARRPSRGISPRVIEWVGEQSDVKGLERLAGRISDNRTAEKVAALAADLRRIGEFARSASSAALLEYARSETGLERAVETLDEAHIGRNRPAHSDDLRALTALGRLHPDPRTFTSWLTRTLAVRDSRDGVTLATVHRVKGLEWAHVIVHDASGGLFPHRLSTDVEEERRVFHVAITRAKSTLHLVADAASPSLFVGELSSRVEVLDTQPIAESESTVIRAVEARVGLVLRWGGYECTTAQVEQQHITVTVGSAQINIPFGSEVLVDDSPRRLVAPAKTSVTRDRRPTGTENPAAFDALRAWRRERSLQDSVPAFVVASDKTLESIAASMPTDEASLLSVHGIGAAKVELYGDEILGIIDALRHDA